MQLMSLLLLAIWFSWLAGCASTAPKSQARITEELRRPVATYSIVARDPQTGQMGVAVQSHWFSVGPIVPWAEAGVGAVATQSFVDPSYGSLGLEMMRIGQLSGSLPWSAADALYLPFEDNTFIFSKSSC